MYNGSSSEESESEAEDGIADDTNHDNIIENASPPTVIVVDDVAPADEPSPTDEPMTHTVEKGAVVAAENTTLPVSWEHVHSGETRLKILRGKYKDLCGIFTKQTAKLVYIDLGEQRCVRVSKSVVMMDVVQ